MNDSFLNDNDSRMNEPSCSWLSIKKSFSLQLPAQSNPAVGNLIDFDDDRNQGVSAQLAGLSMCSTLFSIHW